MDAYRLTFLIPHIMLLAVPIGRHQPCLAGCLLIVGPSGLVSIVGPSRDRVFDQARRFFRVHARKLPAFTVAATLETPGLKREPRHMDDRDQFRGDVCADRARRRREPAAGAHNPLGRLIAWMGEASPALRAGMPYA
jgi:hypothetical protein